MLPFFATPDVGDVGLAYLIQPGQSSTGEGALTNPDHVGLGQFGPGTSFTNGNQITLKSFPHVVPCITEMKMCRMNTDCTVAMMQNILPLGDGTVVNAVGGLMSLNDAWLSVGGHAELPIAAPSSGDGPIPASFAGRDCIPHEPEEDLSFRQVLRAAAASAPIGIAVSEPSFIAGCTPTAPKAGTGGAAVGTHGPIIGGG